MLEYISKLSVVAVYFQTELKVPESLNQSSTDILPFSCNRSSKKNGNSQLLKNPVRED